MKGTLTFEIYHSGIFRKSWKWRAIAPNGKIIASGRGFNNKWLAEESIKILLGYIKSNYELIYKE